MPNTYIASIPSQPAAAKSWWVAPDGDVTDEAMAQVDPMDYISMRRLAAKLNGAVAKNGDTGSMQGAGYRENFLVVIEPPNKEYKPGDDVVFPTHDARSGKGLHRITHVKPGYVYTKGISNPKGDGWTPVEKLYGKVVYPKAKM